MAIEKKFTCNLCGVQVCESGGDETGLPGWGLRSDGTRPGWYKTPIDNATIHVCVVCGPALAQAMGPQEPMHPHLVNALERARAWSETYPVGRLGESGPFEAVRLLRDVAEASK